METRKSATIAKDVKKDKSIADARCVYFGKFRFSFLALKTFLKDSSTIDGSFRKERKERNFAAFSSKFAVDGNDALVYGQKVLLLRRVSFARRFPPNTCGFPFLRYHKATSLFRTNYWRRRGCLEKSFEKIEN